MVKASYIGAIFALLLLLPRAAEAADITCANASGLAACSSLWISGEIAPGDADAFAFAVRQAGRYLKNVLLSSPGGSPQEAMKIGALVRKHKLSTQAPSTVAGQGVLVAGKSGCKGEECVCASACFLVWAGGQEKSGDRLGIHRPVYEFTGRQPDTAGAAYWRSRMKARMLTLSFDLRGYLSRLSVPEKFIARITDARSDRMHWLTANEVAELKGAPVVEEPQVQPEQKPVAPAAPVMPAPQAIASAAQMRI